MLDSIDFEYIVQNYAILGYIILFVGTFLEGETILIIYGFLCAQYPQHLNLHICIVSALFGSLSGDQLAYYLTRWKSEWIKKKLKHKREALEKVLGLLEKNSTWLLLSFRFFYGFRNVTSFAVGISKIPPLRFLILNAIGATIWAFTFGYAGFIFGDKIKDLIKHVQMQFLGAMCIATLVYWLYRIRHNRTKTKLNKQNDPK